jgi:hypothetical protein
VKKIWNSKRLSTCLILMSLAPTAMADFHFDKLSVSLSRQQTTLFEMPNDKTAEAQQYEDLKKFSVTNTVNSIGNAL